MTQSERADGNGPEGGALTARNLYLRRYREMTARLPDVWNDTLTSILSHRSVRHFLPDPLPDGTLEMIIAAAQSAATSSNLQAWSAVAVEDRGRRARLAALAASQSFIVQCPLFLVWLADLHRLRRLGSDLDIALEGLDYLETFIIAVIDAALAAQTAVVALESLGLGTVYVGAIRNDLEGVAAELGLPPHVVPLFGLCVGYPDPSVRHEVKPRLPQEAVLHYERYGRDAQQSAISRYDEHLAAFRREAGLDPVTWSRHATARVRNAQSLHGRDRIRQIMQDFGFKLR